MTSLSQLEVISSVSLQQFDDVDAPFLVGNELGRLSAVVDGDDALLPVGGELGRLPAVVVGDGDVLLVAEVGDGETTRETSWSDSSWW